MTLWIIYLTSTHPKLSKMYVYCIIPSSLFTTIFFKRAKTVHLLEPSASFCGVLNELTPLSIPTLVCCDTVTLVPCVPQPWYVMTVSS